MKRFLVTALLLLQSKFAMARFHLPYLNFDPSLLEGSKESFIRHTGPGKFDNWVGLNMPYAPAARLRQETEALFQVKLQSRPESHVTLITPPEYGVLQSHLTMDEIHELVEGSIQKAQCTAVCLGKSSAVIDGKMEHAFYVVVRSPDLLALRESIHRRYIQKGGNSEAFKPLEYFPHITIGFTKVDIHLDQGAIKDARSCAANLREQR